MKLYEKAVQYYSALNDNKYDNSLTFISLIGKIGILTIILTIIGFFIGLLVGILTS